MLEFDKETIQKLTRKLHNKGIEQTPEQFMEGVNRCAENIGRFLYYIGFDVRSKEEVFILMKRLIENNIIVEEAVMIWNDIGYILKDHMYEIEEIVNTKIKELEIFEKKENEENEYE